MKRFHSHHPNWNEKVHVAELTSGQLISWICVGLFAFVFFFGLGILVGKLDPSLKSADEEQSVEQIQREVYTVPAMAPQSQVESVTSSEEPGTKNTVPEKTPEIAKPRSPFMDVSQPLTALNPLPSNRTRPVEVQPPMREEPVSTPSSQENDSGAVSSNTKPDSVASEIASQKTSTAAESPSDTQPRDLAANISTSPAVESPKKTPEQEKPLLMPIMPNDESVLEVAPQESKSNPTQSSKSRGAFGIQVGAFTGPNRSERAKSFQAKVKKEHGLSTEIIPSKDGVHHRVIVTGFKDKSSAEKKAAELRIKKDFKDAFVRAL